MKLRKSQRLKSSAIIKQVFTTGKSIKEYPILLLKYLEKPIDNYSKCDQIAVVVSKRKFKRAVDRNKIKRMLRLAYVTAHQNTIDSRCGGTSYYLVLSYVSNKIIPQDQLNLAVNKSLNKLRDT